VQSVADLAGLAPRVLAPGHGEPWTDGTAAALTALASDVARPHGRAAT
jgi:hypothetical protein